MDKFLSISLFSRSYFYIKFNRYPKLTKKNGPTGKLIPFVSFLQRAKRIDCVLEYKLSNSISIESFQDIYANTF